MYKIIFAFSIILFGSTLLPGQVTTVTVTNQNIALIKEQRTIELQKGRQQIALDDLPALLDPTSVFIERETESFNILEQNFEYDLLNTGKMLEKALGTKINLLKPDSGILRGTLIYAGSVDLIIETDKGELKVIPRRDEYQITLEEAGRQRGELVTKPTLNWLLEANSPGKAIIDIAYLTRGLSWRAEYVARLNEDDTNLALGAWVSVNNASGKSFTDSRLKLNAGDLHLVTRPPRPRQMELAEVYSMAKQPFQQKEFFEYYIYDLDHRTTLRNNQTKQIQLFAPTELSVNKKYRYNYRNDPEKVVVLLSSTNSEANGLGMALPLGIVRIYKADGQDLEFIGEDQIDHTAVGEDIELEVGKAFDIAATRTITNQQQLGRHSEQISLTIELRNHKKEAVEIQVIDPVPRGRSYQVVSSDLPAKGDATKIEFIVPVKAQSETSFDYIVLYNW